MFPQPEDFEPSILNDLNAVKFDAISSVFHGDANCPKIPAGALSFWEIDISHELPPTSECCVNAGLFELYGPLEDYRISTLLNGHRSLLEYLKRFEGFPFDGLRSIEAEMKDLIYFQLFDSYFFAGSSKLFQKTAKSVENVNKRIRDSLSDLKACDSFLDEAVEILLPHPESKFSSPGGFSLNLDAARKQLKENNLTWTLAKIERSHSAIKLALKPIVKGSDFFLVPTLIYFSTLLPPALPNGSKLPEMVVIEDGNHQELAATIASLKHAGNSMSLQELLVSAKAL